MRSCILVALALFALARVTPSPLRRCPALPSPTPAVEGGHTRSRARALPGGHPGSLPRAISGCDSATRVVLARRLLPLVVPSGCINQHVTPTPSPGLPIPLRLPVPPCCRWRARWTWRRSCCRRRTRSWARSRSQTSTRAPPSASRRSGAAPCTTAATPATRPRRSLQRLGDACGGPQQPGGRGVGADAHKRQSVERSVATSRPSRVHGWGSEL